MLVLWKLVALEAIALIKITTGGSIQALNKFIVYAQNSQRFFPFLGIRCLIQMLQYFYLNSHLISHLLMIFFFFHLQMHSASACIYS